MADADPAAIVADAIDARSLVDLVVAAVGVPSVTPHEERFAHWVREELARGGWDEVELRDAEPGRPNVYAASGAGDGRSLVLAGHLDTVHADDWAAHWKGTDRADPFAGQLVDGEIWGRGAADLKGGICTIIEVLRAVRRAGLAGPALHLARQRPLRGLRREPPGEYDRRGHREEGVGL